MDFIVETIQKSHAGLAHYEGHQNLYIRLERETKHRSSTIYNLAGTAYTSPEFGSTTTLLAYIYCLLKEGSPYTIGLSLLLRMQASSLCMAAEAQNNPDAKTKNFSLSFLNVVKYFLIRAEKDQIMVANKEVAFILRAYVKIGINYPEAQISLIHPLSHAVHLTAPSKECLTPSHALFLQVCIATQMYRYGVEFIKSREMLLEIQPKVNGLLPLDYLKYFHYSGVCFIATKEWPAALEHLLMAITIPTAGGISSVVSSALKKAKLVHLIATGKALVLPKYTAGSVIRHSTGQGMQLYETIAQLMEEDNAKGLQNCIRSDKATAILNADANYGLAEQVIASLIKLRIKQLTKAYCTLSLADIATMVDIASLDDSIVTIEDAVQKVEKLITSMSLTGIIDAKIDQSTGIVRLEPIYGGGSVMTGNEDYITAMSTLKQSIGETLEVADILRARQKDLLTSPAYVIKTSSGSSPGSYLRDYQFSSNPVHF